MIGRETNLRINDLRMRTFTTADGLSLIIKRNKGSVILELDVEELPQPSKIQFRFEPDAFSELLEYFETVAYKSWTSLEPQEAQTEGADYYEYYDRVLDNNGYLSLQDNGLTIERPAREEPKLYQFNKKKMQSFIYDIRKLDL